MPLGEVATVVAPVGGGDEPVLPAAGGPAGRVGGGGGAAGRSWAVYWVAVIAVVTPAAVGAQGNRDQGAEPALRNRFIDYRKTFRYFPVSEGAVLCRARARYP